MKASTNVNLIALVFLIAAIGAGFGHGSSRVSTPEPHVPRPSRSLPSPDAKASHSPDPRRFSADPYPENANHPSRSGQNSGGLCSTNDRSSPTSESLQTALRKCSSCHAGVRDLDAELKDPKTLERHLAKISEGTLNRMLGKMQKVGGITPQERQAIHDFVNRSQASPRNGALAPPRTLPPSPSSPARVPPPLHHTDPLPPRSAQPGPPPSGPSSLTSESLQTALRKCSSCHAEVKELDAELKDPRALERHLAKISEGTLNRMLGKMHEVGGITPQERQAIHDFVSRSQASPRPGESGSRESKESSCKSNPINTLVSHLKRGVPTIDKLIETMPEDYRRYFLVAFRSASRQPATPEAPRAILFGPDAKLVMAFTPTSGLEVTAFNDCTGRQEFYEISETKKGLQLSDENPGGSCTKCHGGNNPHLNWLGYPDWLGFAGAQDDTETLGNENEKHMTSFAHRYKNMDRFRQLVGVEKRFEAYGETINTVSNVLENKVPGSPVGKKAQRRRTLNRHFGVLAMAQNNLRIARMLYDQKEVYDKNRFLLASIVSDCIPRPAGGHGDQAAPSPLFQAIAQKVPGIIALFSDISPDQNRIYERVIFANKKLKLGLNYLEDWKTSHTLARTDSGKEHKDFYPFDDSVAGRTSGGEPSTLYFVSHALGKWDPEFRDLEKFRCEGIQLPLNDESGGVVRGKDFCRTGHRDTCEAIAEKWLRSLGGGR